MTSPGATLSRYLRSEIPGQVTRARSCFRNSICARNASKVGCGWNAVVEGLGDR